MFHKQSVQLARHLKGVSQHVASLYGPSFSQLKANYSNYAKNLSGVICVGGPAMQSSLLQAVQSQVISDPKKFSIIGAKSWLCDVHPDWYIKPWGQNKRYLPGPLREIIDDLYSGYPGDALLDFGMMKNAVIELEKRLLETGITMIKEEILGFKEHEGSIFAVLPNGKELRLGDENYKIINASNTPNLIVGLPGNHTGKLYHSSIQDSTTPVTLLGSGQNLTWTCRDFKDLRQIIHLQPPNDRRRDDLAGILRHNILLDDTSRIVRDDNGSLTIYGIDTLSGEAVIVQSEDKMVFSALGNRYNNEIVKSIDPKKVVSIDCGPNNSSIVYRKQVKSGSVSRVAEDFRGTVMPPGNLKHSFLQIMSHTGQFHPAAPNAISAFESWQDAILESAIVNSISIDQSFFEALKPVAKHIYATHVPNQETVYKVIRSQYEKSGMPAQYPDGTKLNVDEFMALINGSLTECMEGTLSQELENKFKP